MICAVRRKGYIREQNYGFKKRENCPRSHTENVRNSARHVCVGVRAISRNTNHSRFPDTTGSLCRVDDLILERLAAFICILMRIPVTLA